MNAQVVDIQGLFTEPTFAGPGDKEGNFCVPEDWVTRIEALARSQAWDDATAARKAIGFLKGPAALWFTKALRSYDRTGYNEGAASWLRFKALFKDKYFERAEASDVAADWHTLHQRSGESVDAFFDRCAAAMAYYAELLPPLPDNADALAAFRAASPNIGLAHSLAGGADPPVVVTAAQLAYLTAAFHVGAAVATTEATATRFTSVGLAVFTNGLNNAALVSKARMLIRQGKTVAEVRRAIINEDKSGHRLATADITARNRPPSGNNHQPGNNSNSGKGSHRGRGNHNNGGNKQASSAGAPMPTAAADVATDVEVGAFTSRPARGGGRGGRGGLRQPLDRSQPPKTACYYCPGVFHWHADCPRARAARESNSNTSVAAFSHEQGNE
jgi:hypothetical protein